MLKICGRSARSVIEDIPPLLSKDIHHKTFRSVFSIVIYIYIYQSVGGCIMSNKDRRFLPSFSTYDISKDTDQQFIAVFISYVVYIS